ncbi:MAG: 2-hydroxyacyl-CoA dehydratase family protein [Actinomycetota bacterium]|nr:2-hydroxyacyl-CoA dehydratase family protein [Actinomycetota bacterium]
MAGGNGGKGDRERDNSLLNDIRKRFIDRLSPSTLRSRIFWEATERLSRSRWNRPDWEADRISLSHFLKSTRDAYFKRAPVVWSNLLVPSEIIHGTECIPFYPEMASAVVAAAGLAPRFIDRAAEAGFSPDACSFHRCMLGCAVDGFLPEPDYLLTTNYPCDSAPLSFSYISRLYGIPHDIVDIPLPGREASLDLLAEQLRDVARYLAGLSGLKATRARERMEEAFEFSNQALGYLREIEEMRKRSDCMLDGKDAMGNISVLSACMGSKAGLEFYSKLAGEMRERGSEGDNSLRIMWMHLKPWYSQRIFEILDNYNVRVVCEEYTHATWEHLDPVRPFHSLAEKVGGHFLVGPVERRASHLVKLAEDYRIEGAIHYNHWGCRQSCGGALQVKKALGARNIPTLLMDGDCVDEREYQEGQIGTRLEAFLESLS